MVGSGHPPSRRARGFTLVELLVVIGIIAVLIAVLVPVLSIARRHANAVKCASNVRQVCQALFLYADDFRGRFPPNTTGTLAGRYWCDVPRLGPYLPGTIQVGNSLGGGPLVCPGDEGSVRSYAMNFWASCEGTVTFVNHNPPLGRLWGPHCSPGSNLILVAERWSSQGGPSLGGYWSTETVGAIGNTPAQRFGVAGGITPQLVVPRFGAVASELDFSRHRSGRSSDPATDPVGRLNVGYADGHVAMKSNEQLADRAAGRSTEDSLWSPDDHGMNP